MSTNGTLYVGTDGGDPFAPKADGSRWWSMPYHVPGWIRSSPAIGMHPNNTQGPLIYFGTHQGAGLLYAVRDEPGGQAGTPVLDWSYSAGAMVDSSPALAGNDTVWVGAGNGGVHVVGWDGTLRWKENRGAGCLSSPVVAPQGRVYVGSKGLPGLASLPYRRGVETENAHGESRLRVGLISLGCAKNLVDAEIMLGALARDGLEIVNDDARADVVIVNTCSFIDSAQQESVDAILESAAVREAQQRGQALVVSGCLPQRFQGRLPQLLPEVDAFLGLDQVPRVTEIVRAAIARRAERAQALPRKPGRGKAGPATPPTGGTLPAASPVAPILEVNRRSTYVPDYATPRFRLTPRHFAFVKIAEGCNHPCTFCTIPRIRGRHRSRPPEDILEEARRLVAAGCRELNLISQDSTYYGMDLRTGPGGALARPERFRAAAQALPADAPTLASLVRQLNALPGDFWIRLLYTHPAHWTEELIRAVAESPKAARYIDIPLQHIHDVMLERMRRETSRGHIVGLLERLRTGIPGVALRTTFIVGFPGETEACFEALLEFVRQTRFERLGVFRYSREEDTLAGRMAAQVGERVRERRRDRLMALQRGVSRDIAAAQVGRTIRVLVERPATPADLRAVRTDDSEHGSSRKGGVPLQLPPGRYALARGEADAPDIDGRVYVGGPATAGEFAWVTVTAHTDYDLIATVAGAGPPGAGARAGRPAP